MLGFVCEPPPSELRVIFGFLGFLRFSAAEPAHPFAAVRLALFGGCVHGVWVVNRVWLGVNRLGVHGWKWWLGRWLVERAVVVWDLLGEPGSRGGFGVEDDEGFTVRRFAGGDEEGFNPLAGLGFFGVFTVALEPRDAVAAVEAAGAPGRAGPHSDVGIVEAGA